MATSELLTEQEHSILDALTAVADDMMRLTETDFGTASSVFSAKFDRETIANHINVLQNMILSQAAARSYPDMYRQLGE